MSGMVGIWNADGEPVSRAVLEAMNARISHRGPDGATFLVLGSAGFGFQQSKVTPESTHEVQPLQSTGGVIALWDGRLDNRELLVKQLSLNQSVGLASPDVELVLAAYETFGEGMASRLEGDFAFAVFDATQRKLLMVRDPMGARTLCYCRVGSTILFASEIKALLAHPKVQLKLNESALAEFLFSTWDHQNESNTFFEDIHRIPSGSCVVVTPETISSQRFFDFDTASELRLKDPRDYLYIYRDAFTNAVRRRMRSSHPTAIAVSGGLDSSSIYCMAHKLWLADHKNVSTPLMVGMVVSDEEGAKAKADEWEYQKAVEVHCGTKLIPIPVTASDFERNANRKAWHAEGPWVIQDSYEEMYRRSRESGARVFLSGAFGDNLLLSPQFMLDLVLSGKWQTALESYAGFMTKPWLQWQGGQPEPSKLRALLWREIRSFLIPESLRPIYRRLRYRRNKSSETLPYFSKRFQQLAGGVAEASSIVRCKPGRAHAKALYLAARSKNLDMQIEMDAKAAAMVSLDLAYPFRDKDLVQLVMSMPGEMVYPGGDSRGVHRQAMKGVLPESVRLRRTKGDFTRVARLGTLKAAHRLKDLNAGYAMDLGLLKPPSELDNDLGNLVDTLAGSDDSKDSHATAGDLLALEAFVEVFFGRHCAHDRLFPITSR